MYYCYTTIKQALITHHLPTPVHPRTNQNPLKHQQCQPLNTNQIFHAP